MKKFILSVDIRFKWMYNEFAKSEREVKYMYMVTLEAARVNAKLSQKDVAMHLHVNIGTVSNWETGKTSLSAEQFRVLCNLYKCPMDVISLPKKFT